eukprot:12180294-Heterocapsa_arctica.AAC.1
MLDDGRGGDESRCAVRLREIAFQSRVQKTAQRRLERALSSRTRPSAQAKDLQLSELVDLHRRQDTKDMSGWRGPATVAGLDNILSRQATVRWQGRLIDCRIQDVRRHLAFWTFMTAPSAPIDIIRKYVNSMVDATITAAWVFGPAGW